MTVRTEHRAVRTKTTEGQYFPVRLEQARLVGSLLYGTGHGSCYIFFFQMHFRSIKFKGLPARDDASNSERTSKLPRLCKKKLFTSSERFTSVTYGFSHFGGDNIHHTVLSSATGLESPKSLASDRASFLDSFPSIG